MRILTVPVLLFFCVAARAAPIGEDGARHLLGRAGFGATGSEIQEYAPLERAQAVERLISGARREAALTPPAFVDEPFTPYYKFRALDAEERKAALRKTVEQGFELRAWWLREMLATPSPLTERMTLFWHNHFATSQQKVRSGQLMYRQNVLLRSEALGNFATLLRRIARDPAMIVWLDNAGNRKQAPNENFAREVMELFTLGEGHYGERDIKEAARAFTGWSLDRETGEYTYRRVWHDYGEKTVLGRTGRLDGDEVLDILLARPETATFIASKLWRELVSPSPDAAEVARWGAVFREARYEIKPLVRAALMSEAFWAEKNRASLIKSPVDLIVGTLHAYEIRPFDLRPAVFACAALGQNLMSPPNVKGWPGGEAWINTSTFLGRKQWLDRVFRGADPPSMMPAVATTEMKDSTAKEPAPAERYRRMLERGMSTYVYAAADPEESERVRQLVFAAEYQLK